MSALARSVSDAGSGTSGTISPDEKDPVSDDVAGSPARVVKVVPRETVMSIWAIDPTGKSPLKVASPLLLVTVRTASTSNCGEVVLSLMSGQVMVPLIMSESVVEAKEKVSVPPEVIGKTPLVSGPAVPLIAPSVPFPESWRVPVGLWKLVSPVDVNPSVEKLTVPFPLLVKVIDPLAPPIPIISAFAADAQRSGPAAKATAVRNFLLMVHLLKKILGLIASRKRCAIPN
jgi:hypothetical protein